MGSDVDVLVVGAGPAGLLLAGDLSRGRSALHRRGTARRGIPADSRIRRSRPNDGATGRPRPCRRPADDRPPQPDPAIPADRSVAPADPLPPRAREMRFPPRLKPGIPTQDQGWHGRRPWTIGFGRQAGSGGRGSIEGPSARNSSRQMSRIWRSSTCCPSRLGGSGVRDAGLPSDARRAACAPRRRTSSAATDGPANATIARELRVHYVEGLMHPGGPGVLVCCTRPEPGGS